MHISNCIFSSFRVVALSGGEHGNPCVKENVGVHVHTRSCEEKRRLIAFKNNPSIDMLILLVPFKTAAFFFLKHFIPLNICKVNI